MQVLINIIFDLCSTLFENMTFSNILAIFAVVIAFFAFRSSKKISQGHLFANFEINMRLKKCVTILGE